MHHPSFNNIVNNNVPTRDGVNPITGLASVAARQPDDFESIRVPTPKEVENLSRPAEPIKPPVNPYYDPRNLPPNYANPQIYQQMYPPQPMYQPQPVYQPPPPAARDFKAY